MKNLEKQQLTNEYNKILNVMKKYNYDTFTVTYNNNFISDYSISMELLEHIINETFSFMLEDTFHNVDELLSFIIEENEIELYIDRIGYHDVSTKPDDVSIFVLNKLSAYNIQKGRNSICISLDDDDISNLRKILNKYFS